MGERLRDMQEEWFYLPERERLSNPLTAATGMLYFQYLRDCGRYEESADVAEQLLEKEITQQLCMPAIKFLVP